MSHSQRAALAARQVTGLGAAVATASIASPALTGVAWANTVTAARPGWPTEYFTAQPQWWWCSKCSGFFYSSGGSPAGICPAGYAHNPYNSWMYETVYDHFSEASVQEGWRWCNWCQGLFWPLQASSHCPGNVLTRYPYTTGPHNVGPGSYDYSLLVAPWNGNLQPNWLWCSVCQGLFHANSGVNAGLCPVNATSQHQGGKSWPYLLFIGHK